MYVKVKQLLTNSGYYAQGQYVIQQENGTNIFQSWGSTIAVVSSNGSVKLDYGWSEWRTTVKYVNQFLGCNRRIAEKNLRNGIWLLADLNPEKNRVFRNGEVVNDE